MQDQNNPSPVDKDIVSDKICAHFFYRDCSDQSLVTFFIFASVSFIIEDFIGKKL